MREQVPVSWKGDDTCEAQVLNALFPILARNYPATEAVFDLVRNQDDYT